MTSSIFGKEHRAYVDAGYEPRRIRPGGKACKDAGWNKPDAKLPDGTYTKWANERGDHGIGLRLGTVLADGTLLSALDIDDERLVRAARFLLGDPPCGRVGSKGIAYFVRIKGELAKAQTKFDIKPDDGKPVHVGELLGPKSLVVIPPTIHPDTNQPYRWIGKPLLETDFNELPIIEV